ncbi:MAG TPA: hypothetical protein VFR41_02185, partial [Acidimicrobiia bacterium]|nr:hypothetical protein [Acidimicrobiia bacterium]
MRVPAARVIEDESGAFAEGVACAAASDEMASTGKTRKENARISISPALMSNSLFQNTIVVHAIRNPSVA